MTEQINQTTNIDLRDKPIEEKIEAVIMVTNKNSSDIQLLAQQNTVLTSALAQCLERLQELEQGRSNIVVPFQPRQ